MIVLREIRHFKRFFPNLPHFLLVKKKKQKEKGKLWPKIKP